MISPFSGLTGAFINSTISGLLTQSIAQLELISKGDAKGLLLMDIPGRGQFVLRKVEEVDQTYPTIAAANPAANDIVENDLYQMSKLMQRLMHRNKARLF